MAKIEDIKIITLGNSAVGKSSFILKYTDNVFSLDYLTTLGVDYKHKKIKLKNGKDVRLRIFDTAGQERFKSVSASFVKKADGVILIYDIGEKDSFEAVENWIKSIREIGKDKLPIILVGNKCDLSDDKRQVSLKEGQDKANEFNIPFYETSCKEGINIKEVFEKLIDDIIEKGNKNLMGEFKILNKKKGKKKEKCC
jgi:small GTP-binding protein